MYSSSHNVKLRFKKEIWILMAQVTHSMTHRKRSFELIMKSLCMLSSYQLTLQTFSILSTARSLRFVKIQKYAFDFLSI